MRTTCQKGNNCTSDRAGAFCLFVSFSPQVFGLPLSGSDHMPLQPVESIDEDREDLLEQAKCTACLFLSYS